MVSSNAQFAAACAARGSGRRIPSPSARYLHYVEKNSSLHTRSIDNRLVTQISDRPDHRACSAVFESRGSQLRSNVFFHRLSKLQMPAPWAAMNRNAKQKSTAGTPLLTMGQNAIGKWPKK